MTKIVSLIIMFAVMQLAYAQNNSSGRELWLEEKIDFAHPTNEEFYGYAATAYKELVTSEQKFIVSRKMIINDGELILLMLNFYVHSNEVLPDEREDNTKSIQSVFDDYNSLSQSVIDSLYEIYRQYR